MIKPINQKGAAVLYENTVPVAPIVKLRNSTMKKLTSSLSAVNEGDNEITESDFMWPNQIISLVTDLMDTAESIADTCWGLAATQIWDGDPKQCPAIFIMRWPREDKERGWHWQEFINPMIQTSGKTLKLSEGCLSYPGLVVKKSRSANLTVRFQTIKNPKQVQAKLTKNVHGEIPHVIQHEMDHLMGKCVRSKNFKG